jgi:RNA polymerase sigma-70 factor (ECF subfamily)
MIAGTVVRVLSGSTDFCIGAAEEIVQEVYVKLCSADGKALRAFVPLREGSDFSYLAVIARNVAITWLRSRKSGGQLQETPLAVIKDPEDERPAVQLHLRLRLNEVEAALLKVASERERQIFWLYYRVGLTALEISRYRCFGLEESGVESLLVRLVVKIRRILDSGEGQKD